MRKTVIALALLVLTCGVPAFAQKGSLNLESLIRQSGMIFAGKVIDIETGVKDRMNLYMTAYTFKVLDPIYGVEGDTIRIKQYGGEAGGKKFYPSGIPRFEQGEEVLVMLYPPSRIGMTSAVGKDQGKFWIKSIDSLGTRVVFNKLWNKGLFKKLKYPELITNADWISSPPDSLPYGGFLDTVRHLAAKLKDNGGK